MSHSTAIKGLEKLREEAINRRNTELRKVAEPYNIEIKDIENSILQLKEADRLVKEAQDDFETPIEIPQRRGGNRRKRIDHTVSDFQVYPFEEGIVPKFRYILKEAAKILTVAEVANKVKQYEPSEDLELIKIRFGKHVKKYEAQGYIKSIKTRQGKKYGLPEWFGDPKSMNELVHNLQKPGKALEDLGNMLNSYTSNALFPTFLLQDIKKG